jgi:hypothetical protein
MAAAAAAARWGQGEREPREIGSGTDEVGGEASVAKSVGGAAEEGAAVGRRTTGLSTTTGPLPVSTYESPRPKMDS